MGKMIGRIHGLVNDFGFTFADVFPLLFYLSSSQ